MEVEPGSERREERGGKGRGRVGEREAARERERDIER
jgi:hypothetical protein